MGFQWLDMRIAEEKDRRQREGQILERLPHALEEVHRALATCIGSYVRAFGPESAEIQLQGATIRIAVRHQQQDGKWQQPARIEVTSDPLLPGLRIERGAEPLLIEVGVLAGSKMFYKDQEKFLTMDELTRRVLDRAFFPKLGD